MPNVNIVPILPGDYTREVGSKVWHWNQIYFGPEPSHYDNQSILSRYVPVVGDIVMHPTSGDWIVGFVSEQYVPTLQPRQVTHGTIDINDSIIVPTGVYNTRADVMHVDTSTTPIRFTINSRIYLHGGTATHYKVFRGTNIANPANSIGAVYNGNGAIIGDNIELKLAAFAGGVTNQTVKTPTTGYLRELPLEGSLVTIVAYTIDGHFVDKEVLVISYENFVASTSSLKYIADISLETPYLSQNDSSVIEIPRNMSLKSLALFGVLTYNDGSKSARMPVNGTKFSLLGLDAFTASVDLQSVGVQLSYALAAGEAATDVSSQGTRRKSKAYTVRTIPSDAAYSVKLFVLPTWNKAISKWELRYRLFDMRRDINIDVTNLVQPNTNFAFNPNLFNQKQTVQVAINLQDVGSEYKFYRPVQVFYITLLKNGSVNNAISYVKLGYSTSRTFGDNVVANKQVVLGKTNLDLSCGFTNKEDWLRNIYKAIEVLNVDTISSPPVPTHFRIKLNNSSVVKTCPIDDLIAGVLDLPGLWLQGDTLLVEFISVADSDILELGAITMNINVVS